MATTSTVTTVKAQLVTSMKASTDMPDWVTYSWAPWGDADQVFLGVVDGESNIATIKAGRKHRQETYTVDVVLRAIGQDKTPQSAQAVEERAFGYLAALEDILADDVQVDGLTSIQWARLFDFSSTLEPKDKGWGCQITCTVEVTARLQ